MQAARISGFRAFISKSISDGSGVWSSKRESNKSVLGLGEMTLTTGTQVQIFREAQGALEGGLELKKGVK